MLVASAAGVLAEQASLVSRFWNDRRTRTPILVVWVASFGGALHHAVTPYFYLEVGASALDIGYIGFIMSAGRLAVSPLVGWALDVWGPFLPISITAAACAAGCLIRGAATTPRVLFIGAAFLGVGVNLWTTVLAHLASCNDREHRSGVLSGFAVQETALSLLGKGLFVPWDYFVKESLGVFATLPRYRVHMGICTFFCIFGTVALAVERFNFATCATGKGGGLTAPGPSSGATDSKGAAAAATAVTLAAAAVPGTGGDAAVAARVSGGAHQRRYALLVAALLVQSFGSTVVGVLWPLVLRDRFGFTAPQYAAVAFASSLAATACVAAFPAVERRLGPFATASACAACAAACVALAFVALPALLATGTHTAGMGPGLAATAAHSGLLPIGGASAVALEAAVAAREGLAFHVLLGVVLHSALLALEPSLKSIFSLSVPVAAQGRSIGLMSTLGGGGGMGGNLLGTYMYAASKERWAPGALLAGGRLPFAVVSLLLSVAAVAIRSLDEPAAALRAEPCVEKGEKKGGGAAASSSNGATEKLPSKEDSGSPPAEAKPPEPSAGAGLGCLQRETSYALKLD